MDPLALTRKTRALALDLGFVDCRFSKAGPLDEEARALEQWLSRGDHGTMEWMERNFDLRVDPTRLVPGAKTVICLAMGYRFEENEAHDAMWARRKQEQTGASTPPSIAKYARGRDYHKVLKHAMRRLYASIEEHLGASVNGRIFVDSAPVMERAWAVRSGLGWLGKNGNLLRRDAGSWILLGEIILDVEFIYDGPVSSHCGSCSRCIDACPTQAITSPGVVDSRSCISYLTIEFKQSIPSHLQQQMQGWAFGCDICQDVCPWNRKATYGVNPDLRPREKVLALSRQDWTEMDEVFYEEVFSGSPLKRAGLERLKANAKAVMRD